MLDVKALSQFGQKNNRVRKLGIDKMKSLQETIEEGFKKYKEKEKMEEFKMGEIKGINIVKDENKGIKGINLEIKVNAEQLDKYVEEKLKESCEHKYSLYQKGHPFAYFYCEKCLIMKKINVNHM